VTDAERIGKKPKEADLSYTACTALASQTFSNRNEVREGSEGKRGSEKPENSGTYTERVNCGKNDAYLA
jgi:hypothetical protein